MPCTSNAQYEVPLASSTDLVTERPALLVASKNRSTPSQKEESVSTVGFWVQ